MARSGTTLSSLPPADVAEDEIDEQIEEEELPEEFDEAEEDAPPTRAPQMSAAEQRAYDAGWRPLAEYRGRPGGWISAEAYLERGENYMPFVKKDLAKTKELYERSSQEIAQLREIVADQGKNMRELLDFSRRANQAGYDRAIRDLKAEQRTAAEAGDLTKFDQVQGKIDAMEEVRTEAPLSAPAAEAPRAPAPARPGPAPEYQEFLDQNSWFNTDRVLNAAMIEEHNRVIRETPGLPLWDQLERAKEAVVAQFPKKFGVEEEPEPAPRQRTPRAPLAPSAGNRGQAPRARAGIDGIQDPRERAQARTGFQKACRDMPDLTEAEYLEVYNNPKGDVLDTIHKAKARNNGRA